MDNDELKTYNKINNLTNITNKYEWIDIKINTILLNIEF